MNLGNIGARNLAMVPITALSGLVDPVPGAEVSQVIMNYLKMQGVKRRRRWPIWPYII